MRRTWIWIAVGLVLAGCGNDIAGPAGSCVALVNVSGVAFTPAPALAVAAADVQTEPLLTVSRNTGCNDLNPTGEEDLAPGESNFLESGTTLHTVDGYPAEDRLAVFMPEIEAWQALVPAPSPAGSGS